MPSIASAIIHGQAFRNPSSVAAARSIAFLPRASRPGFRHDAGCLAQSPSNRIFDKWVEKYTPVCNAHRVSPATHQFLRQRESTSLVPVKQKEPVSVRTAYNRQVAASGEIFILLLEPGERSSRQLRRRWDRSVHIREKGALWGDGRY